MNIIKTTGIGIVLIMLCTVCSKYPEDPGVRPEPEDYKSLNVVAEVSQTETPVKIADNYQIELFGNATSCNLSPSGAPCITVIGMITKPDALGNFSFEEGELLLASTTTECKLWGQFDGDGVLDGNVLTITSQVEVTCGTGLFTSNGGFLNMTIKGLLASEENPSPIYELTLNGQLEN
jgi:hypothetical protein